MVSKTIFQLLEKNMDTHMNKQIYNTVNVFMDGRQMNALFPHEITSHKHRKDNPLDHT